MGSTAVLDGGDASFDTMNLARSRSEMGLQAVVLPLLNNRKGLPARTRST